MTLRTYIRQIIKKLAFGGDVLPTRFFIGQPQPQREITVWLHGFGSPRDVSRCHCPASTVPCTFWVAFPQGQSPGEGERSNLSLQFCEGHGKQRVLGEIGIKWTRSVAAGSEEICIFEARSADNYCHSRPQLWAHALLLSWRRRHSKSSIKLSRLERRAMSVLFIYPRPISIVSVTDEKRVNIFPLNVMSDLPNGYFAFALTARKLPAQFLESARFFALSVTPVEQGSIAFNLAVNHNNSSIKLDELPFETKPSRALGIPVPIFSPRTREMEIESVHTVGSHSLFVARTISDEPIPGGSELAVVHGFYQSWRLRNGLDGTSSIAENLRICSGVSSE